MSWTQESNIMVIDSVARISEELDPAVANAATNETWHMCPREE